MICGGFVAEDVLIPEIQDYRQWAVVIRQRRRVVLAMRAPTAIKENQIGADFFVVIAQKAYRRTMCFDKLARFLRRYCRCVLCQLYRLPVLQNRKLIGG